MNDAVLESLKFPIGKFQAPKSICQEDRVTSILRISLLPSELTRVAEGLSDPQLDTPYRPNGWTVRQVIHHIADSHMNSMLRFRWALTEDIPVIKPYEEALWAELPDARSMPPQASLDLLDGLHRRWTVLLTQMSEADFARRLRHPELGELSLDASLALYAWHGRHHVAHIRTLRERMGW